MDISFDLETLSLRANALILSIGAAKFDIETGEVFGTFYSKVKISSQPERHSDWDTMCWWQDKDEEVRSEAFSGTESLAAALTFLSGFVSPDDKVWGNGSSFDITILENAFNGKTPWRYWNVRDLRTLVGVVSDLNIHIEKLKFEGTVHNALDDAKHQAARISQAYRAMKACTAQ